MSRLDDIYNENIKADEEEVVEIPEEISKETVNSGAFSESIEDSIIENNDGETCAATHEVVMLKATSRVATQLKDVWYSFEFTETRKINDDSNIEAERQDLWDTVNVEVDKQVQDVIYMLKSGS